MLDVTRGVGRGRGRGWVYANVSVNHIAQFISSTLLSKRDWRAVGPISRIGRLSRYAGQFRKGVKLLRLFFRVLNGGKGGRDIIQFGRLSILHTDICRGNQTKGRMYVVLFGSICQIPK